MSAGENSSNRNNTLEILHFANLLTKYETQFKALNDTVRDLKGQFENITFISGIAEKDRIKNFFTDENNVVQATEFLQKVCVRKKEDINKFIIDCLLDNIKKELGNKILGMWITIIIFVAIVISIMAYKNFF